MLRTVAVVAALAAAVTGCGGEDDEKGESSSRSEMALLERAAEQAASLKTYKATVKMEVTGSEPMSSTGEMVGTTDGKRSRLVMDVQTGGQALAMEMVQFGDQEFIRGKVFEEQLPPGKEWLRQTDDTPTSSMPIGDFFKFLGSTKSFENIGEETVRGTQTTRFGGALDLEELARTAGPEAAERFRNMPGARSVQLRLDVWVDQNAKPLRMAVTTPAGSDERIEIVMDFQDFDVPADFEPPPAGKVADPADLNTG